MWLLIIWGIPAVLSTLVGVYAGAWGAGIGLAFAWIGFCIFQGSIIVEERDVVLVERLGKYHRVYFRGWHIRVIGVDSIRASGRLLQAKRLQLYADEENNLKMDFKDASASIDASIWYQIGNPKDVSERNLENLIVAVKAWVYVYEDSEERIYNLVDGAIRPLLQQKTIDEAAGNLTGIAKTLIDEIAPEMEKFGAYMPSDTRRFIIEDIQLPDEVIVLRSMVLEGQKRAEESEKEAAGYWKAIKTIQDNLEIPFENARDIYQTQRGLDTLEKTKPAITLVGKDLNGILGSINLGQN